MIDKTDLHKVRSTMQSLLYIPFEVDSNLPIKNNNPIMENVVVINKNGDLLNLIEGDEYEIDRAIDFYKRRLQEADINHLFIMVKKPYQLEVFDMVSPFLDKVDFNTLLSDIYKNIEFPNWDNDIEKLKGHLESIDKELFMDEKNKRFYESLPEQVTVYRGVYSEESLYDALSWTTEFETAQWFANRFGNDGIVLKGEILKEDIYCCYLSEHEVVLNPEKVNIIEQCSSQKCEALAQTMY